MGTVLRRAMVPAISLEYKTIPRCNSSDILLGITPWQTIAELTIYWWACFVDNLNLAMCAKTVLSEKLLWTGPLSKVDATELILRIYTLRTHIRWLSLTLVLRWGIGVDCSVIDTGMLLYYIVSSKLVTVLQSYNLQLQIQYRVLKILYCYGGS